MTPAHYLPWESVTILKSEDVHTFSTTENLLDLTIQSSFTTKLKLVCTAEFSQIKTRFSIDRVKL